MLIERPPLAYRWLFPDAIWRIPAASDCQKTVYITFDDGPIPEITPWVLNELDKRDIKATFFCVGENVWRYHDIFDQLLKSGHTVGNHTYHHIQGLKNNTEAYICDVKKANKLIQSSLFRPPHGHIKVKQLKALIKLKYKVIMWDLVSRDYSKKLSPIDVFENVKRYVRDGSIIVFHDSIKAERNLRYALPKSLDYLQNEGYAFKLLPGRTEVLHTLDDTHNK